MTLPADYAVEEATPATEDYLRLRVESGLSPKSEDGAAAGLPNTYCAVVIKHDGKAIGMGRIIGDGGLFFQVVDIAVQPAHQGKGLGKIIMTRLLAALRRKAPSGAYVSLIADGDAKHLYAQFGFVPTAPASIGMATYV
jgi:predicted N-acetyltransferase YhbS